MDNRNDIYTIAYNDLFTYQGREEFAKSLARLSSDELREVLLDQHSLHHDNLVHMLRHVQRIAATQPNPFNFIRQQIQEILAFDSFEGSYIDAPPNTQKLFLLVLLKHNASRRKQILENQAYIDSANLSTILTHLIETWPHLYSHLPNYTITLNNVLNLKETLIPVPSEHSQEQSSDSLVRMPETISSNKDKLFADIITFEFITSPWIAPQGTTYQYESITQWLHDSPTDPLNRSPLNHADLIQNKLYSSLVQCLFDAKNTLRKFMDPELVYQTLCCPLSGERLKDPVVAEDGVTYERAYLEAYLSAHDFFTPCHVLQQKPLYTNRFLTSLYEQTRLDLLLDEYAAAKLPLAKENAHLIKPLRDYLGIRAGEGHFAGWSFGYNKWDKMISSVHLIHALSGTLSPQTFFGRYPYEVKVLKQGRLKTAAQPALNHLESNLMK
ncbi:hypothetical protein AQUSIP_18460 [Aquicella siphonis]|uniref:RING-type E3 ubiquitin transferase n=1 Tax=Aquicella siphonis TaxID=254247 RepID=A0A5E4PHM7_9COXI|nr:U-box domain-containing protein [Aquicella siphonis]VVC76530.1 hypothetical protein AQUSIP_18460 [Aquicella siphonis]